MATPKKVGYFLKLDPALIAAVRRIKVRDGIPESEQIRRGIRMWLKTKGVVEEADGRRAPTRRQS